MGVAEEEVGDSNYRTASLVGVLLLFDLSLSDRFLPEESRLEK